MSGVLNKNHLNRKSGNVFELRIIKLEVEQIHKSGGKNPKQNRFPE